MQKIIVIFIIGFIFLLISVLFKPSSKEQVKEKAMARVEWSVHNERGAACYHLSFDLNGERVNAESIYYESGSRLLQDGEEIEIEYYYNGGRIRAIICEKRMIPCNTVIKPFSKWMKVLSIVFFAIGAVMTVKYFK